MYRNVLVPVDLSDKHSWRKALPTAISLCEAFEARQHLIAVVPEFSLPTVGQFLSEGAETKLR
jgi:nucleotide-binding universal stress UspA family protein